mmetsp:Transcript_52829/g.165927  ORF Transcript_52829/g.165927 Transcript_52829/m.165927 type:complete len:204 (-) Transcript_52829:88-699(-)
MRAPLAPRVGVCPVPGRPVGALPRAAPGARAGGWHHPEEAAGRRGPPRRAAVGVLHDRLPGVSPARRGDAQAGGRAGRAAGPGEGRGLLGGAARGRRQGAGAEAVPRPRDPPALGGAAPGAGGGAPRGRGRHRRRRHGVGWLVRQGAEAGPAAARRAARRARRRPPRVDRRPSPSCHPRGRVCAPVHVGTRIDAHTSAAGHGG